MHQVPQPSKFGGVNGIPDSPPSSAYQDLPSGLKSQWRVGHEVRPKEKVRNLSILKRSLGVGPGRLTVMCSICLFLHLCHNKSPFASLRLSRWRGHRLYHHCGRATLAAGELSRRVGLRLEHRGLVQLQGDSERDERASSASIALGRRLSLLEKLSTQQEPVEFVGSWNFFGN